MPIPAQARARITPRGHYIRERRPGVYNRLALQ